MKTKEIKEYLEKGYLHLNVIFEVVGKPKDHVEKMIKKVMEGVMANKDIVIMSEEYEEAQDAGEGLWGTVCETEMLVKGMNNLSWLAFNFSPASIEVKAPKEFLFEDKDLTNFMGELLSQLHQNNMNAVRAKSESQGLLLNFNAMIRNAVLLSLRERPKSEDEVGENIGVTGKDALPVLNMMVKENKIEKKGEKYYIKT